MSHFRRDYHGRMRCNVSEKDDMAQALRAQFEQWYTMHAHNYSRDPIGSRDCALQWEAWKAAHESRAQPAPVAEPVGRVHIQLHRDCPSMRNVEFLEDIELPPGTHLLYTNPPEPARDAARYRWLREQAEFSDIAVEHTIDGNVSEVLFGCDLDEAIDAAMAQESGDGE